MSNDKPVFIVDGVQVYADGKPVVQEPAQTSTPAGGEELEKLRSDRDSLFGQVQALRGERDDALNLASENGRLLREARAAQDLTFPPGPELLTEISTLKGQGAQLTEARDEWQKRAETAEARPLLPADALERLKSVDGIGDKLAQKALDALTVPTQSQ